MAISMHSSDEDLVALYLAGEKEAFAELAERHLSGVYSFVLRFVGGPEEAEDVTQETFVKAWKNLAAYKRDSSKFKTWLMRIARNAAIDFLRKKKHIPFSEFEKDNINLLAETVADSEPIAEAQFAQHEDAEEVQSALLTISPAHREVLLLYYTNDLTFEDMGEMLGEPANTTKSRHRRALLALKEALLELRGTKITAFNV